MNKTVIIPSGTQTVISPSGNHKVHRGNLDLKKAGTLFLLDYLLVTAGCMINMNLILD